MHSRTYKRLGKDRLRDQNMTRKLEIRVARRHSVQLPWSVLPVSKAVSSV